MQVCRFLSALKVEFNFQFNSHLFNDAQENKSSSSSSSLTRPLFLFISFRSLEFILLFSPPFLKKMK